jgi:hypothetical protein
MKKQLCAIAILLGFYFAFAATNAHAQSASQSRAHIPFDFIIGDKTLPAGDYIVNHNSTSGTLVFRNRKEGKDMLFMVTMLKEKRNEMPQLVFNRYGATYFLAQVQNPEYQLGVAKSRREHELHRRIVQTPSGETTARLTMETVTVPLAAARM